MQKYLDSHIEHNTGNLADTWQIVSLNHYDMLCIIETAEKAANSIWIEPLPYLSKKYVVYSFPDNSTITAHYSLSISGSEFLTEIGIGNFESGGIVYVKRCESPLYYSIENILDSQSMAQYIQLAQEG